MTMASDAERPSILLIDDTQSLLEKLHEQLSKELAGDNVNILTWAPNSSEGSPQDVFHSYVDENTVLVITDYDLTSNGKTGLFGPSIVGWCQTLAIPVGDFSRGNTGALPKEPNLFELRVPTDDEAAPFIASTFRGFKWIRDTIEGKPEILASKRSLAGVLASLLGRANLESQFALYMARIGSGNSSLVDRLRATLSPDEAPDEREKVALLSYVIGHSLLNAILKFPGPILSEKALCAYVSTTAAAIDKVAPLFSDATYQGPFAANARFFWREDVDMVLDNLAERLAGEQFETFGELNRRAVEAELGSELPKHPCPRCHGKNGGFLCPFTYRSVCQRSDCSVTASSWIPQGAQLCRVEKDFYDEWAPLLGM